MANIVIVPPPQDSVVQTKEPSVTTHNWKLWFYNLYLYITTFFNTTTTTVGAAGTASSLPANPVGYVIIPINGVNYKVPFYNL